MEWIEPAPTLPRRLRWAGNAFIALAIGTAVYFSARFGSWAWSTDVGRFLVIPTIAFMALFMLGLARYLFLCARSAGEMRLGATDRALHYRVPRMQGSLRLVEGEEPWDRVYRDDSRLLVGSTLVDVRMGTRPVFETAAVDALLQSRLPSDHRLSTSELTRRAWHAGAFRHVLKVWLAALVLGVVSIRLIQYFSPEPLR